ncbi:MAG: hypothetical protein VX777_00810, partial [Chlamydiota bacterium]|nr:hypothetical protein [Chlamydiota bacterium]
SKEEVEKRVGPITIGENRDGELYQEPLCLYFSSLEESPEAIIERDGISMDSIKVNPNKHWGINSIQLSESILHADRTGFTTHVDGENFVTKKIFVCETLLGLSAKYDEYCPTLKRPPEIGSINYLPYHYNSIRGTDHELGVEVHSVFDPGQVFLRYLIEYTVPIKDPNPAEPIKDPNPADSK